MILVTGATGFLGKRVCRRLEQRGDAFTRTSLSLGTDLRDFHQTLALFQTTRPKIVLNCASFAGGIQFGLKYPADIFCNNMPMIANLFEAARRSGVERIVNPLANCVYPAHLTSVRGKQFWDGPLHESVMVYALSARFPGRDPGHMHANMGYRPSIWSCRICTARKVIPTRNAHTRQCTCEAGSLTRRKAALQK